MKTILALVLAASFQAHAQPGFADEIKTIITCERAVNIPDLGLSVKVTQGGIAGLTEVQVHNFYLGHTTLAKYYVREVPVKPNIMGAPLVYRGNGIVLSISFTTAPNAKGGHRGFLEITEPSGDITTDELSCSADSSETTNQLSN